jgi:hypothetical protein
MISYLVIRPLPLVYTGQSQREPASPDTARQRTPRLQVQDLGYTGFGKDVMIASDALGESERAK